MTTTKNKFSTIISVIAWVFVFCITACNGTNTANTPNGGEVPTDLVETPIEATAIPTPTQPVGTVWLVAPPNSNLDLITDIKPKIDELAAQSGLISEHIDNLNSINFESARFVILIGNNPEVNNLAANHPETHFVMISQDKSEAGKNLSLIRLSPTHVSFVAGFIATLIAPDWRSGGLFAAENPLDGQLQDSFANGGRYLCGRCVPVYAPVVFFPLSTSINTSQGLDSWKAGFDQLNQNRIEVLYLAPEMVDAGMLNYLQSLSVVVVGSTPPPDGYNSIWAATVNQNLAAALEELWAQINEPDSKGIELITPLVVTDINDQLLPPGKLNLVEKVAADLRGGWIEPLSVP